MRVVSNTSRSTLWLLASCSAAQYKQGELIRKHSSSNRDWALHLDELDVVSKSSDTQGENAQLQTTMTLYDCCHRLMQTTLTGLMSVQQHDRG